MNESRIFGVSTTLFELSKYALIIVVAVVAIVIFIGTPLLVRGESMEPNFFNGEVVVVDRVSFGSEIIARGEVVAAKFPADPKKTRLIKRILGLPGETIYSKDGEIFINNQKLQEPYKTKRGVAPYTELGPITLGSDEYFLVGDNRPGSSDSRLWGAVSRDDIVGRVSFILFPISNSRFVEQPGY